MFWSISLLVLLIAGLLTLGPLLGKGAKWRLATVSGILLLPLAGYWLYQGVGTPQALNPAMVRPPEEAQVAMAHEGNANLGALTERLHKRLEENPNDVQGWVLLGRSYKNLQNYPAAIEALEKADKLSPGMPLVQVELVEARLFASGSPQFTPEMVTKLEKAVEAEPKLQKGLWLLGIAAAEAGDDAGALKWWEKLRSQLAPGSSIEKTLTEQIAQVKMRLGQAPEPTAEAASIADQPQPQASSPASTTAAQGMDINVELSDAASRAWPQVPAGTAPPGAVLFIIAKSKGAVGGPPLGARRVAQPHFPLHVTLTDADSIMPQRPISSADQLELEARLSLSGTPAPSAGDWQSAVLAVSGKSAGAVKLVLDQAVK